MKIANIINSIETVKSLNNNSLPFSASLKMVKNTESFQRILEVYNSKRAEILKDFDAETASKKETDDVLVQLGELIDTEIENEEIHKLTEKELTDCTISPSELSLILWMVETNA